jgi:putative transposase
MPFWRMHAPVMWTSKGRRPLIGDLAQEIISHSFNLTFVDMEVIPHAVGYMPDHIHLAVSIPPKVAVADLVRRLNGPL